MTRCQDRQHNNITSCAGNQVKKASGAQETSSTSKRLAVASKRLACSSTATTCIQFKLPAYRAYRLTESRQHVPSPLARPEGPSAVAAKALAPSRRALHCPTFDCQQLQLILMRLRSPTEAGVPFHQDSLRRPKPCPKQRQASRSDTMATGPGYHLSFEALADHLRMSKPLERACRREFP